MSDDDEYFRSVNRILDRLRIAHENGKGVRLSADDIHTLSVTILGETWQETEDAS